LEQLVDEIGSQPFFPLESVDYFDAAPVAFVAPVAAASAPYSEVCQAADFRR
jgi:hypothetical protein